MKATLKALAIAAVVLLTTNTQFSAEEKNISPNIEGTCSAFDKMMGWCREH